MQRECVNCNDNPATVMLWNGQGYCEDCWSVCLIIDPARKNEVRERLLPEEVECRVFVGESGSLCEKCGHREREGSHIASMTPVE